MTDLEKKELNLEIAESIEPKADLPHVAPHSHSAGLVSPRACWRLVEGVGWHPRDFAGDANAALEMGERLREMGLWNDFEEELARLVRSSEGDKDDYSIIQASAEVRTQAAEEVLRERGKLR